MLVVQRKPLAAGKGGFHRRRSARKPGGDPRGTGPCLNGEHGRSDFISSSEEKGD